MGLFDMFKPKDEKEELLNRINKAMSLFTDVSLSIVPYEILNKPENEMKGFMYFFGAIDSIAQEQRFNQMETMSILTKYLSNEFKIHPSKVGDLVIKILENSNDAYYGNCMDIGGRTFIKWSNQEITIPYPFAELFSK